MCRFVVACSCLRAPERADVVLVCGLVPNEGVEERVVEGLVLRLAGEHCAEVRAAPCAVSLALETDKGPPTQACRRPQR